MHREYRAVTAARELAEAQFSGLSTLINRVLNEEEKDMTSDTKENKALVEVLRYSNFIRIETRWATLAPDQLIYEEVGLDCPRCKHTGPLIEHATQRQCRACELWLARSGNELFISLEKMEDK